MDCLRFFLLTLCVSACIVCGVNSLGEVSSTATTLSTKKAFLEKNTNIELTNDNHNLNGTKNHNIYDSNIPKSRKVTPVIGSGADDKKSKGSAATSSSTETKIPTSSKATTRPATTGSTPKLQEVKVSEAVVINVPVANVSTANKTTVEVKEIEANSSNPPNVSNATNAKHVSSLDVASNLPQQVMVVEANSTNNNNLSNANKANSTSSRTTLTTRIPLNTSTISTSSSTTTTKTTTTTTTTTRKPKKPKITYSVEDFPDLDKESLAINNLTHQHESSSSTSSGKFPAPEVPLAQPSQEFSNTNFHGGRDYIIPIVSMVFIIPLVIGILITTYRRFRDCWSTRHYRRMDFLVDGMYND